MTATKGPWEFSNFCNADGSPITTVDEVIDGMARSARQSERAELWGVTGRTGDGPDDFKVICYTGNGPTSAANANLIAASPTMLEALKEFLQEFRNGGVTVSFQTLDKICKAVELAEEGR